MDDLRAKWLNSYQQAVKRRHQEGHHSRRCRQWNNKALAYVCSYSLEIMGFRATTHADLNSMSRSEDDLQEYTLKRIVPGTPEYSAIHQYVRRHWGKPDRCEHCGTDQGRIEWANVSGQYLKERDDWLWLCSSCHGSYDQKRLHCKNGHKYTPENSYVPKGKSNQRRCKECNRLRYWARKEAA